jgi:hypothetical protein
MRGGVGAGRSTARRRFFVKKEAKTLVHWRARCGSLNALIIKSFLVLFCKKERLPVACLLDDRRLVQQAAFQERT